MSNCYCLPGKAGGLPITRTEEPMWTDMSKNAHVLATAGAETGRLRVNF